MPNLWRKKMIKLEGGVKSRVKILKALTTAVKKASKKNEKKENAKNEQLLLTARNLIKIPYEMRNLEGQRYFFLYHGSRSYSVDKYTTLNIQIKETKSDRSKVCKKGGAKCELNTKSKFLMTERKETIKN